MTKLRCTYQFKSPMESVHRFVAIKLDSDLLIPRSAFLTLSVLLYVKRAHADLVIG